MATYIFNVLKDQLANGYLHLDDATRDGSTITGDNTHTPVTGTFRACLIAPGSTLVSSSTTNGAISNAVDIVTCDQITTLNELNISGYIGMAAGNEPDNDFPTAGLVKVAGSNGYTKWVPANLTINSVASGSTINGVLIVWDKNTGSNDLATKVPLVWIGLGSDVDTNGGDITINWATTGAIRLL